MEWLEILNSLLIVECPIHLTHKKRAGDGVGQVGPLGVRKKHFIFNFIYLLISHNQSSNFLLCKVGEFFLINFITFVS